MGTRRLTRAVSSAPPIDLTVQIEAVATELFIRNGYNGVSYLGIGRELGITHSNVHYYYRTKAALATAVLKRVAKETLQATEGIWTDRTHTLAEKFVRMRDWAFDSYLRFNPEGKGGRPWGLLSRFSMEADALTPEMRQNIRATLRRLEDSIRVAVETAIANRELVRDAPVDGITLQISSVMYQTGQLTRHASGFSRLDALLMWTIASLLKAYGGEGRAAVSWPAVDFAVAKAKLSTRPAQIGAVNPSSQSSFKETP